MLQNLGDRLKRQRWLAMLILGPLALIFAVWGVYGIADVNFSGASYGLKINGESIPVTTIQQAWQQRQSDFQQQSRTDLTEATKKLLQEQLVGEFVRSTLLNQAATRYGYRISDATLGQAIRSEPSFHIDGKFDPRAYRGMLAQLGMTTAGFEAQERRSLQTQQLVQSLQISDFLTPAERKRLFELENEQRQVRYAIVPVARFAAAAKVDEATLKAWYESHAADYQSPESVRLQYAEMKLDDITRELAADTRGLQAYYEANKSRYTEEEKRRARHILIRISAEVPEAAALKKAQELRTELVTGKDFAELARKDSEDPGSAAAGGELGWAGRDAYVKPFADALYALQPGEISEPVQTQFGYHLIQLEEVRPGQAKTLDSARAEIEADYRRQRASELFGDRMEQLQQGIEDGSLRDIGAVASKFHMTTGEIANFTRSGATPLGGDTDLVAAVFSDESLSGGRLVGPVALGQDRLAVVKVLEYRPAAAKPFETVRAEVMAAVRADAGAKAARATVDEVVAKLDAGADLGSVVQTLEVPLVPELTIGRGDPRLPVQLRDAAFTMPRPDEGKPSYLALSLDDGNAALLAVFGVQPGAPGGNPQADEQLTAKFVGHQRDADLAAYIAEMERRAKIQRNDAAFE